MGMKGLKVAAKRTPTERRISEGMEKEKITKSRGYRGATSEERSSGGEGNQKEMDVHRGRGPDGGGGERKGGTGDGGIDGV